MEIVGLLVIVILIVIIIFFSLSFNTNKSTNTIISFQDKKLASQLGPVIAETTVQCENNQEKLNELIRDCATTNNQYDCDSCKILNQTIELILEETLKKDLEYALTITGTQSNMITNFTSQGCIRPRNVESFLTPIATGTGGSLLIMIKLCT